MNAKQRDDFERIIQKYPDVLQVLCDNPQSTNITISYTNANNLPIAQTIHEKDPIISERQQEIIKKLDFASKSEYFQATTTCPYSPLYPPTESQLFKDAFQALTKSINLSTRNMRSSNICNWDVTQLKSAHIIKIYDSLFCPSMTLGIFHQGVFALTVKDATPNHIAEIALFLRSYCENEPLFEFHVGNDFLVQSEVIYDSVSLSQQLQCLRVRDLIKMYVELKEKTTSLKSVFFGPPGINPGNYNDDVDAAVITIWRTAAIVLRSMMTFAMLGESYLYHQAILFAPCRLEYEAQVDQWFAFKKDEIIPYLPRVHSRLFLQGIHEEANYHVQQKIPIHEIDSFTMQNNNAHFIPPEFVAPTILSADAFMEDCLKYNSHVVDQVYKCSFHQNYLKFPIKAEAYDSAADLILQNITSESEYPPLVKNVIDFLALAMSYGSIQSERQFRILMKTPLKKI